MKIATLCMLVGAMAVALGVTGCGQIARGKVANQADRFIELLRDEQVAEAYAILAEESRQETSLEDFRAAAETLGLTGNQDVSWETPYIDDDYASIEGIIRTRNGSELPQELVYFKQGGEWILHIVREPLEVE